MPDDERVIAYISLGSNEGSRIRHLGRAVEHLAALSLEPPVCSPVYETKPVGFVEQRDFLNMVVRIATRMRPRELLHALQAIEQNEGRVRTVRFGPRTLDLDILLYDNETVCYRDLQIPHSRMWERAFVLVPLSDIAPQVPALGGQTVQQAAAIIPGRGEVRYVGRFW